MAFKVTSFEPLFREDWIHGGRILACIDLVDDEAGLMLNDLFLTYDGETARVRAARREGKHAQVHLVEGRPTHDRAALAAKAYYDSLSLEELREIQKSWQQKTKDDPKGAIQAPIRYHRKAA
jgi:hypothetical protein